MTVIRGFIIIGVSALVCTMAGIGIGCALATFAPNFYRNSFPNGRAPDFDPMEMGLARASHKGSSAGSSLAAWWSWP